MPPAATALAANVPSIQDRKAALVRAQLAHEAISLLLERGFDAVTIDDLAAAAGISRRSFFRYFPTKEDVIISGFEEGGAALLEELGRRTESAPLLALRSTLDAVIATFATDPIRGGAVLDLVRRTPTLRARFLLMQDDWTQRVAAALRARMKTQSHQDDMRAHLIARVAIATIDSALVTWSVRRGEPLRAIAAEAFDALSAVVREAAVEETVKESAEPTVQAPRRDATRSRAGSPRKR